MQDEQEFSPDWSFWLQAPALALPEAAALSLNFNPILLLPNGGKAGIQLWMPPPTGFSDRLEFARRAVVVRQLAANSTGDQHYVAPTVFAVWALGIGWEIPVELRRLAGAPDDAAASPALSTAAAETRCRQWLTELMCQGPSTKARRSYEAEAIERFGISRRAFSRAWGSAIATIGTSEWSKPGPKSSR